MNIENSTRRKIPESGYEDFSGLGRILNAWTSPQKPPLSRSRGTRKLRPALLDHQFPVSLFTVQVSTLLENAGWIEGCRAA